MDVSLFEDDYLQSLDLTMTDPVPAVRSGQPSDHGNDLVPTVTVLAGEIDEFLHPTHHCTSLRRARHGDAPSSTELDEPFISQDVHGSEHRVLVYAQNSGNVDGEWKPITRPGFALCDGTSDLTRDLIVKRHGL